MPPKRTSTSETPAITLAAIQQLINDGISSALKAQSSSMAVLEILIRNTQNQLELSCKQKRETIKSSLAVNLATSMERKEQLASFTGLSGLNRDRDLQPDRTSDQELPTNGYAGNLPLWPQESILRDELATLETTLEDIQLSSESSSI
ncbi:hypothetical protein Tco_0849443 [Tanacetum coccineum]